jgi:hypothetical protein
MLLPALNGARFKAQGIQCVKPGSTTVEFANAQAEFVKLDKPWIFFLAQELHAAPNLNRLRLRRLPPESGGQNHPECSRDKNALQALAFNRLICGMKVFPQIPTVGTVDSPRPSY